jgi:carboxymethylenebutenolidase
MCFDDDARPPIPPIEGGALDAGETILTAADGTRSRAWRARAAEPTGAGMVILPDVRGLHPYYEDLAYRFAEHGVDAVAIDYFGRTAGSARRDPAFEAKPHVDQTSYEGLAADVRAGADFLRSGDGGAVSSLFTVGFCYGGRLAFLTASLGLDLAGVIGFYGVPVGPPRQGMPAPADVAASFASPVLALYGGADPGIPAESVAAFERALEAAGIEHRVVTYPNAPHSFFDRKADEYARTSEQAWAETLEFVRAHTRGGGAPGTT